MGVDSHEPLWFRLCQRGESLCNRLLEVDAFVTYPVPDFLAREALVRIDSKEHNHAGPNPEQTGLVGAANLGDAKSAARSLIRERRVHRSIRQNPRSSVESGTYHFRRKLGPSGGEEKCLGPRCRREFVAEENLPDGFPNRGPARLAHADDVQALGFESFTDSLGHRRLPRTFDALERDVRTAHLISFLVLGVTETVSQSWGRQAPR